VAYAEHMGVYRHGCLVEHHALNDICRFPSHSGQFHQLFESVGNLAPEVFHQHLSHAYQMLRLVVGVAYAFDVFIYDFRCCGSKRFRSREVAEERRGDHVHPLVGALCAQNNGDEQLERVFVMQFRFCHGHRRVEVFDNFLIQVFLCHISIPFFASEIKIKSCAQQKPGKQVAELPVEFGHEAEVHPPYSGEESQRNEDGGNDGELLHDIVHLLVVVRHVEVEQGRNHVAASFECL